MLIAYTSNLAATKFRHLLRLRCEWRYRNKSSFCFCMNQGCTDFPKSRNHVKILEVRKVIRSKCPTKDTQISAPPYKHQSPGRPGAEDLCTLVSAVYLHCFVDTTFVYSCVVIIPYYIVRSWLTCSFGPRHTEKPLQRCKFLEC